MSNHITQTFVSNVKKLARSLKNDLNITHSAALELAAKHHNYDSYHALITHSKKCANHESDIVNGNLGTNGVNITKSKADGNRGKQLNPNQKHSLTIAIKDDCKANVLVSIDDKGRRLVKEVSFKDEFLDKGLLERISARRIGPKELAHRALKPSDHREIITRCFYVEFLKDTEWDIDEAFQFIRARFSMLGGSAYAETIWLDNYPHFNFNYDEYKYEDLPYCPGIDGYHDFHG